MNMDLQQAALLESLKEVPNSCQYSSTIPEKNLHVTNLSKTDIFVGVRLEKMMDHQYEENGAKNVYSNYNQMRAYVECSPNK